MLTVGSELMRELHKRMLYINVTVSPWVEVSNDNEGRVRPEVGTRKFDGPLDAKVQRTVTYIMPRSSIVKANHVTEKQSITHFSSRGFILEVNTR